MDIPYLALLIAAIALNAAAAFYRRLGPLAFVSVGALVAYHYALFLLGDFRLVLVYINAAVGQTALERATAAIASIPGAVYLMALPTAAVFKRGGHLAAALLLTYAALERPFLTIDDVLPGYIPQSGMGLNPLLRSVWAVPHPVAVLVGYGLIVAAAASSSERLLKWGWASVSLGLLLGAIWSYQTFGWAGYWAWDPVENALLAVWLVTTAALHLKNRGGMVAAVGVVLGAVGLNQGGFSALHSFVGGTPTPQVMLAASLALLTYGIYKSTEGVKDGMLAMAAFGMMAVGVVIYITAAVPALYSIATSTAVQPPAGDVFVASFLYPLAASVLSGLFLAAVYHGVGVKRGVVIFAAILALSAVLSWVFKPAFESPIATNFFVYAIAAAALAAAYQTARSNYGRWHKALHVVAFLLVALLAASGPFSYSQSYYKLLAVDRVGAVYFTLLDWPYPQQVSLVDIAVTQDGRVVEVPPTAQVEPPPNYTAFVKRVDGKFSLGGLNYSVVELGGIPYVVVWGGGQELGRVGGVPVVEVERNGTVVVFPAPLDLIKALETSPRWAKRFLECFNSSRLAPGGVEVRGVLSIDGVEAPFVVRYDISGWLKGVGALTAGVVDIYKPVVGYHAVAIPPTTLEGVAWDYATRQYAALLLQQCNAPMAYAVLKTTGVKNLTSAVTYLEATQDIWVVGFKPVPLILELWVFSAILIIVAIYKYKDKV
ncbi:MAG: cytochrome c biogenesis protein CcsA [Pyrobaculum sp.]